MVFYISGMYTSTQTHRERKEREKVRKGRKTEKRIKSRERRERASGYNKEGCQGQCSEMTTL